MQFTTTEVQPLLQLILLFSDDEAMRYFSQLLQEVSWNDGFYTAFGRRFSLPRLQAWYADEGVAYHYAENLLNSHCWTPTLKALQEKVIELVSIPFNAVLVNRYRDGNDSVGWHADDERDLGANPVIASLSLGAQRTFWFREKTTNKVESVTLANGSLLLMQPPFQRQYEHAVLAEPDIRGERINLTFRLIV